MKVDTYCCQCQTYRFMDSHGRCELCGSGAIVHYPGEVEPVFLPSKPKIPVLGIVTHILGGAIVLWIILGTYCLLSGGLKP
jgi:hypothetical protein